MLRYKGEASASVVPGLRTSTVNTAIGMGHINYRLYHTIDEPNRISCGWNLCLGFYRYFFIFCHSFCLVM